MLCNLTIVNKNFQEEIPLKLKSLLVITLIVIACSFASAQTFGFGTAGGDYLYCNYEQLSNTYGAPFTVWQGTDNLSACAGGQGENATMGGVKGALSKPDNPFGAFPISGVVLGDNLYDAYSLAFTAEQWTVVSNLKCTNIGAKKAKEGWVGIASYGGFVFGGNYGVLACTVYKPEDGRATKGVSFGKTNVKRDIKRNN